MGKGKPYQILVLLGSPGSGKGTFCKLLSDNYNKISTGDLLREEVRNMSEIGQKIEKTISKGLHVPDLLIWGMIKKKIENAIDSFNPLILDGFPQTLRQFEIFRKLIQKKGVRDSICFVYLKIDAKCALARITHRQSCSQCSAIYNLATLPPKQEGKCDYCNAELFIRREDSFLDAQNRISCFLDKTYPILEKTSQYFSLITINANVPINQFAENCMQQFG